MTAPDRAGSAGSLRPTARPAPGPFTKVQAARALRHAVAGICLRLQPIPFDAGACSPCVST
jgi:hypothetical protein